MGFGRRPGRGAHTLRATRQPSAPLVLFLVQWSLAVHWEEQRAGEDSETHIQTHRDDLAPGPTFPHSPSSCPGRGWPVAEEAELVTEDLVRTPPRKWIGTGEGQGATLTLE